MEKMINQNHIIDNIDIVEEKLNTLIGGAEIDKIIDFVNSEENTIFYFDRDLSERTENDSQAYLAWVDSGYCYKNEPIFISLINYDGEYCGHYVGTAKFLVNGMNNCRYRKEYMQNLVKFNNKYLKKVAKRTRKHLEMIPEVITFPAQAVQREMTAVTEEIYDGLLYPSWKSIKGLDRYIKIVGRRVEQLISEGKNEYFVMNNIRSVVVNTGLINLFGNDCLVLYKMNQKYGTYVAYQVISGKKDYLDNGFTREQASVELKPIQFIDAKDAIFEATISDFDINDKCLTHIIEERRSRFPEELRSEPASRISVKLMESLKQGLKIQMRDHSYAKLTYSGKDGQISWLLPLHINNDFTREPELAMVIRRTGEFYEVKTILPYDDELKDRITALSLYSHLW